MFKLFFKIAYRNITRKSNFSLVNILGLSLGMSFAFLLLAWVIDDLNTDNFHHDLDQIYLVGSKFEELNRLEAAVPYPVGGILKRENPEIVEFAHFINSNTQLNYKVENKVFFENKSVCSEASFFEIFNFKFIEGSYKNTLESPLDVLISESKAKKFFGKKSAIGKTLLFQNSIPLTVKAVFKDLPSNSQFDFEIMLSYKIVEKFNPHAFSWHSSGSNTFVKLSKGTNIKSLENKVKNIIHENSKTIVKQPIHFIHLNDYYYKHGYGGTHTKKGSMQYIWLISAIAIFLLFTACVNFINLSIALMGKRFKEVGLKKTFGSSKYRLMFQFLLESAIVTTVSIIISILLYYLMLPYFEQLLGEKISVKLFSLEFMSLSVLILILLSFAGGIVPALVLSKKSLVTIFKDKNIKILGGLSIEKILVVVQFTIAIFMIISTLLINKQMHYMQTIDLGFDKEKIVFIKSNSELSKKYLEFKSEMSKVKSIASTTIIDQIPTLHDNSVTDFWYEGKRENEDKFSINYSYVDTDFFKTMGIKIINGKGYTNENDAIQNNFIINQKAQKFLKLENPIDKQMDIIGKKGRIIGVAENAQFKILHMHLFPRVYIPIKSSDEIPKTRLDGTILIRIKGNLIKEAMNSINNWCKRNNISVMPDIVFLDREYQKLYEKEEKINQIFKVFSSLSIIISCIGLFILNVFYTQRKSKELAIRKINGASTSGLFISNLNYMLKWLAISILLASPLAFYIMTGWLENFAVRTQFSWWIFLIAGSIAFVISLITVSWQSYKSATQNPVEALRYE
jgi:ABC-type antimicrobial peptide transport system permease subunit